MIQNVDKSNWTAPGSSCMRSWWVAVSAAQVCSAAGMFLRGPAQLCWLCKFSPGVCMLNHSRMHALACSIMHAYVFLPCICACAFCPQGLFEWLMAIPGTADVSLQESFVKHHP